jgi:signal transduction histidine kinase/DNA-binding response OmpR family regulator/streptogramin lyase
MTEDLKGRIWFGSNIEQLNISDTTQSRFTKTPLLINVLRKFGISDIQTLCISKSNVLWLGTQRLGLACYDFSTKEAFIYNTQNSNLPDNDIRVIKEDSKGNIWVGTNKGGLCSFYQKSQSFEVYNPTDKNQSFIGIRQLAEDNSGNWWIGTEDNGIKVVNPMSGKIVSFESNKKGNYYIPDNYISSIFIDNKDQIWVGTRNGGLCYYNKANKIFKSIPARTGIPQSISRIEADEKGNLWISSISSVYCFNTTTNTAVSYSKADGIIGGLFLINSGIRTSKGRILFAATNGIMAFNPKNFFSSSETAFPTVITALQLSTHTKDETENLWIKNLEQKKSISLKHNQSSFTIYFVSPNFEHANETKYAYYLEGEESTWNYMGNNNFASYRNLKPGKYIFKVKASNANNIWCKKVRELEIVVEPPLWETWPMKIIYFLLLCIVGWALWKYASGRINRINTQKIKEIERKKNDEINNAKLQFFTNISHEFRTPITLILSPLSKLIDKETEPDKKYLLEVMRKNSNRLLRLVNEVLDFRKLDNETIQLHYEKTNIVEFINELTNSFSVFSREKKINISFLNPDNEIIVSIDRMVVEKTILNLVSNAIKFSFEGSEVIVSVENDLINQQLVIEVKDFGIGLNHENKTRIFEQFYQVKTDHQYIEPGSGIGLYLVKSLVELHRGCIRVESEENKGSRFIVNLPYNINSTAIETGESSEFINNSDYNWDAEIETIDEDSIITKNSSQIQVAHSNTKYNLLIVEDDVDVRDYLVTEFRDEFHITEAGNGLVALEISKEKNFDIVLSDIMMPKMNGIEFCNAFKKDVRTSHIPLILLTAKSSMENKIEGIEFGADDYIIKPFNVKYLRTKIYSLIHTREEMRVTFGKSFSINMPIAETQSIDDILITKAIEFIKENITNTDLNGEMLADKLNISRVHLYRKLKALVDCSSSEFIRRVRLKHAKTLLEANNLNISEIAYDCGFSSPAYFSTCFSNFYGMSPKEYLQQKQNPVSNHDF